MKTKINLNAELRLWLSVRLSEVLGDNPDNINTIECNLHEAKDDIFRLVYDYQVARNWPHIAANTANVLGISEMHVHRLAKKKGGTHKLTLCYKN